MVLIYETHFSQMPIYMSLKCLEGIICKKCGNFTPICGPWQLYRTSCRLKELYRQPLNGHTHPNKLNGCYTSKVGSCSMFLTVFY